ncbi:MAG: hypothetical protein HXK18_06135 [Alloprevotella tannerae]|nr:hypothetical protein [Alloprevotella tannerae]
MKNSKTGPFIAIGTLFFCKSTMKKSKIGCLDRLDVIFFDVYGAFTDKQPAILSPQASSEAPTRAELREPLCFIFFLILDPRFAILEITSRKFDNPPRPTHHDHILVYKWLHYASLTPRRLAHFLPKRTVTPIKPPRAPTKTPLLIVKSSLQCSRNPIGSHENRNKTLALTSTSFFITSADFFVASKKSAVSTAPLRKPVGCPSKVRRQPRKGYVSPRSTHRNP